MKGDPYSHPRTVEGKGVFGSRLKAERIRRGYQVTAFAAATGIDQTQITGYENRGIMPSFQSVIAMAKVLDCSIDWLAGLED